MPGEPVWHRKGAPPDERRDSGTRATLLTPNEVSRRGVGSFHGMAERGSVVTNSNVTRDDRQEGRLVSQRSGGCQMNGIQSTNRFNRKGASGMSQDRLSDTHNVTTPGKPLQGEQRGSLLLSRDPSREARTKNSAAGFGKREGRGHPLSLGTNGDPSRRISLKQGRDQGACFDVAGSGYARGPGTVRLPGTTRLSSLTLRHGRCQLGRRLSREGGGFQGSLPGDHRPRRVG